MILVLAWSVLLGSCHESAFERAHDQAVARNPTGVELQIRLADGSNKVHAGDPVRYEEFYTSKYPGWSIEIADGMNAASISDSLFITDGKSTWTPKTWPAYVCCDSRQVGLGLDPARLPYRYAQTKAGFKPVGYRQAVMPKEPGRYQFYVTTERVFSRDYATTTFHTKGFAVTSDNILTVEVVQ